MKFTTSCRCHRIIPFYLRLKLPQVVRAWRLLSLNNLSFVEESGSPGVSDDLDIVVACPLVSDFIAESQCGRVSERIYRA